MLSGRAGSCFLAVVESCWCQVGAGMGRVQAGLLVLAGSSHFSHHEEIASPHVQIHELAALDQLVGLGGRDVGVALPPSRLHTGRQRRVVDCRRLLGLSLHFRLHINTHSTWACKSDQRHGELSAICARLPS